MLRSEQIAEGMICCGCGEAMPRRGVGPQLCGGCKVQLKPGCVIEVPSAIIEELKPKTNFWMDFLGIYLVFVAVWTLGFTVATLILYSQI